MLLWDYSSILKFSGTSGIKSEVAMLLLQAMDWRIGPGALKAGLSEKVWGMISKTYDCSPGDFPAQRLLIDSFSEMKTATLSKQLALPFDPLSCSILLCICIPGEAADCCLVGVQEVENKELLCWNKGKELNQVCIALYKALPLYMKQVNTQWAPMKNYVHTETSFLLPDFIGNLFLVSQGSVLPGDRTDALCLYMLYRSVPFCLDYLLWSLKWK